jgi:hypothetical protein
MSTIKSDTARAAVIATGQTMLAGRMPELACYVLVDSEEEVAIPLR